MQINFDSIQKLLDAEDYDSAIAVLETSLEDESSSIEIYWYLGLANLLQGNAEFAEQIWLSVMLSLEDECKVEQELKPLIEFLESQVQENIGNHTLDKARLIYCTIKNVDPKYENKVLKNDLIKVIYDLGNCLRVDENYETARDIYLEVINIDQNHALSWRALANCYTNLEEYESAERAIRNAIKFDLESAINYQLLGIILEKKDQQIEAIEAYEKAISLDHKNINVYAKLGNIYLNQDNPEKAIEIYKASLNVALSGYHASIYKKISSIYRSMNNETLESFYLGLTEYINNNFNTAIPYFEKYLAEYSDNLNIILKLAYSYASINQYQKAIKTLEAVSKVIIEFPSIKVVNQAILPLVYDSHVTVVSFRERFNQLLDELLINCVEYEKPQFHSAFNALPMRTTYFLGYQGLNDVEINRKYSQYIYKIVRGLFLDYCQHKKINTKITTGKVRLGYISSHFGGLLGKLYLNWIKYCNCDRYEIYAYDISGNDQTVNHQNKRLLFRETLSQHVDIFKYVTGKVESIASEILNDDLDILIFPDIGLNPKTQVLSVMRLAPIQCAAWGHPMTSGSPNIDYFLSSAKMEPKNAEEHYTETLVQLPNLGFSLNEIALPQRTKNRLDFCLPEQSTVYLCCQSLFKYLPKYDYLFPDIVRYNSLANFIFIDTQVTTGITSYFKRRLQIEFNKYHLDYEKYCIFTSALPYDDYLTLLQLSDIFLDTFGWSGGITTIDAIACGLPIVTCPGEMMRSRQSYGMLNMIGVTETIAENEQDYIDIAVRLGQDHQWRQSVREKMQANKHKLFNDKTCIVALEEFFEKAIAKKIQEDASQQNVEP